MSVGAKNGVLGSFDASHHFAMRARITLRVTGVSRHYSMLFDTELIDRINIIFESNYIAAWLPLCSPRCAGPV
jgi:hypothetical protein